MGFSLPGLSSITSFVKKELNPLTATPFHVIESAAKGIGHLATGAIKTADHFYEKVTPSQLKSVLRWTPAGLALRAGAKVAPDTLKILGSVVKWSPYGMVYRGARYELPKLQAGARSAVHSAESSFSQSPYEKAIQQTKSRM